MCGQGTTREQILNILVAEVNVQAGCNQEEEILNGPVAKVSKDFNICMVLTKSKNWQPQARSTCLKDN
jgi:hypothetical protein